MCVFFPHSPKPEKNQKHQKKNKQSSAFFHKVRVFGVWLKLHAEVYSNFVFFFLLLLLFLSQDHPILIFTSPSREREMKSHTFLSLFILFSLTCNNKKIVGLEGRHGGELCFCVLFCVLCGLLTREPKNILVLKYSHPAHLNQLFSHFSL